MNLPVLKFECGGILKRLDILNSIWLQSKYKLLNISININIALFAIKYHEKKYFTFN
jgi:hypothetical protein